MFKLPASADVHVIEGQYSLPLVVLSFVLAFAASYTALFINRRIKENGFFSKSFWLALASLAMGLGIWSMHFIGMSAFMLPVHMEYRISVTILSIIPAIIASYLALYFANRKNNSVVTYIAAGIYMGIGISLMHYIGMAAMEMGADYVYKPSLFILSVVIAMGASFASLYIFSIINKFMDRVVVKVLTSLLLAVAITSMHYTGMSAVQFYTTGKAPAAGHGDHAMDIGWVIGLVTICTISLFLLAGLTSQLDKYVDYRLKNFDALTKLPNQKQFADDQKNGDKAYSVAIIHLHNLEKYIMGYGYSAADDVVKSISERIESLLPQHVKLYQTEANRFTIVHTEGGQSEKLVASLEKICAVLKLPALIEGRAVTVEMVCALSTSDEPEYIQKHFSNAIAVLQSPSTSYNHEVIEFNPAIHTFNFERQLAMDIQSAMDHHQLFLVYQPKMDPEKEQLAGLEALIRWRHPVYGMISPGVFIPILEESQKIYDVTDWIIERACEQISLWNKKNVPFGQVSINIPGIYVTSPRLTGTLNENLEKYSIHPTQLELEITETSVIHDMDNAILALGKFRDKGLSVALDDFGTGLSSLSYLKRMPITTIKIDKSFVDGVPTSEKDAELLKAIIILGYSLKLHVVIEGVETNSQIEFLRAMEKQPIVQGYYYSKPLEAGELEEWMGRKVLVAK
ncbi:MAG: EAL domain-containing protein [Lysinibacillus sp.]